MQEDKNMHANSDKNNLHYYVVQYKFY